MSIASESDDDIEFQDPAIDIESFIALFDAARNNLLQDKLPDVPFSELNPGALQKYINLVLCGVLDNQAHIMAPLPNRDALLLDPETTLWQDIDSALVFRQSFPWEDSFDLLTTYHEKKSLHGHLHAHVRFQVSL
jgi:hypothetical protein